MRKKTTTANTGRRRSGVAATVAAALPLALSMIPSGGISTSSSSGPSAPAAAHGAALLFKPGCELPFDGIKTEGLEIDAICSMDGNAGDDTGKRLESNAKNNFCVDGKPTPITYDDLKSLQAAADKVDGLRNALKKSRKDLDQILSVTGHPSLGEGSLVQFVAFVLDAHNSNVGKKKPPKKNGELVNCNQPDKESNDIHIELTMDPNDDDACNGVTAEMSPHFRPEAWSDLVNMEIKRPVRITGPLFFDSSHQPCRDGKRVSPPRISVWEIHPIYQFEVCNEKTLKACDVRKDSQWTSLDQLRSNEGDEPNE